MEEESGEFRANDGRLVTFSLYGPVSGPKVVCHNGTPGTRHLSPRMIGTLERHGVRLLVMDRPGYIWFGRDDVLCPRNHADWLLSNIPNAEQHELPHGHLLDDEALDAIYNWLLAPS